jgi:hypothetical protein
MQEETVQKTCQDLGCASYLMMHGYKVVGKKGRSVIFEISVKELKEFEQRSFEYLSSPFHQFDSCLMSLKKMGDSYQ